MDWGQRNQFTTENRGAQISPNMLDGFLSDAFLYGWPVKIQVLPTPTARRRLLPLIAWLRADEETCLIVTRHCRPVVAVVGYARANMLDLPLKSRDDGGLEFSEPVIKIGFRALRENFSLSLKSVETGKVAAVVAKTEDLDLGLDDDVLEGFAVAAVVPLASVEPYLESHHQAAYYRALRYGFSGEDARMPAKE